ncbi:hypothetical protein [Bradyrhizobium sp. WSM1253]|nr:hypothetical protein [Bradyrhizobium sp. WSM1253]EIG62806.1 hypothetical protein Bra1253DRAFT_07742 [Bradyrhizobium sp. WSM1253]
MSMIRIELDKGVDGKMDKIGKSINKALVLTLTDAAVFPNEQFIHALKTE